MAAPRPVPPAVLRRIFELKGYHVERQDEFNWVLFKSTQDPIIMIPKTVSLVPSDVLMHLLDEAVIDDAEYFALVARAGYTF